MTLLTAVIWVFKIAIVVGLVGAVMAGIDAWRRLKSTKNGSVNQSNSDPECVMLQKQQELVSELETKVIGELEEDLKEKPTHDEKMEIINKVTEIFEHEKRVCRTSQIHKSAFR